MSVCVICGGKPDLSVNCLVSTRRVRPRAQKCSCSLLLCSSCIRALRGGSGHELALCLLESLHDAYTAIEVHTGERNEGAE
jgi:hypothetical protein